jgi:hypothetical protein
MIDILSPLVKQFLPFAKERMGFERPPRLFLRKDAPNAQNPLGKTAFYDPEAESITLYVTDRHPKDIMRSLSHELVHHKQNCAGEFEHAGEMGEGYAQNDEHMREMEREAYETGNMCFRDWEDSIKSTIYFEHLQRGEKRMSIKDWKNKEITTLLSEAWGFNFDLDKLNEDRTGSGVGHGPGDDDPGVGERESEGEELSARMDEESSLDENANANLEEVYADLEEMGGVGSQAPPRQKPHKRVPVPEDDDDDLEEGTKKGEKTEKGEEAYEDPSKGEEITTSGSKKRGSKKGDKAYVDERRARGRADPRIQRGPPDARARPLEEVVRELTANKNYTEDQVREALKRVISKLKESNANGQKR